MPLQLIWVVHTGILTLLTLYPLVWFFTVELNVISLDWEMWIYANLDISAKLLLTSVLSNLTAAAYDYDIGKTVVWPLPLPCLCA